MKPQEKPRGLLPVVLLSCVLNFASLFTMNPADPEYQLDRAVTYIFTPLHLIVLWFLWKGRNWARVIELVLSFLSLSGVLFWNEYTLGEQVTTVGWTLIGVFLLYWLNTKPVKEYFKPVQPATPYNSSRPPIPEP
ncbi:MAG TPA: hypothetical protein VF600_11660 [Abditibacteriaceae bacterium]|jgi:hypothetical protein